MTQNINSTTKISESPIIQLLPSELRVIVSSTNSTIESPNLSQNIIQFNNNSIKDSDKEMYKTTASNNFNHEDKLLSSVPNGINGNTCYNNNFAGNLQTGNKDDDDDENEEEIYRNFLTDDNVKVPKPASASILTTNNNNFRNQCPNLYYSNFHELSNNLISSSSDLSHSSSRSSSGNFASLPPVPSNAYLRKSLPLSTYFSQPVPVSNCLSVQFDSISTKSSSGSTKCGPTIATSRVPNAPSPTSPGLLPLNDLPSSPTSSSTSSSTDSHLKWDCHWIDCNNKQFRSLSQLVLHIEYCHIDPQRYCQDSYICYWFDCPRQCQPFNARYKLLNHMRIHSEEKPNTCPYPGCNKAFSRQENLKIHIRSHTGEKPYRCHFHDCTKAFSNSSDRAKHQRTHFDSKPYACLVPNCPKRYTDPSSLRKHMKTHPKKAKIQYSKKLYSSLNLSSAQHRASTTGYNYQKMKDGRNGGDLFRTWSVSGAVLQKRKTNNLCASSASTSNVNNVGQDGHPNGKTLKHDSSFVSKSERFNRGFISCDEKTLRNKNLELNEANLNCSNNLVSFVGGLDASMSNNVLPNNYNNSNLSHNLNNYQSYNLSQTMPANPRSYNLSDQNCRPTHSTNCGQTSTTTTTSSNNSLDFNFDTVLQDLFD